MNLVELTWRDLTLRVGKTKKLLDKVSGQISPGKITAVIGPSGSGKTTLLNSVAGRNPTNLELEGQILANGRDRDPVLWPKTVAYVNQVLHALKNQTVYETLSFAANAKLNAHEDIAKRVEETIAMLSLEKIRDSFMSTLSGGERTKVNIGIEYIGNPSIIFLDEPTSGLDSSSAISILEILQKLAELNKTVILTIHQPSYNMLMKIDQLIVITKGMIVFDGTVNDCITFYAEAGFEIPPNTNPSNFFLNSIDIGTSNEEIRKITLRNFNKLKAKWDNEKVDKTPNILDPITFETPGKKFGMFNLLLAREGLEIARNISGIKAKFFQKLVIGIFFGFTYFRTGFKNANIYSLRGVITFLLLNDIFSVSTPTLNKFATVKKVLERERMSGLYNGIEAYYSKFISTAIYILMFETPYTVAVYYLVGLNSNFGKFTIFFMIVCETIFFAISYGLTMGISTPNLESAHVIGMTVNFLFTIYCGAFDNPSFIPSVLAWLVWLSPYFYTFSAGFQIQLRGETVNGISGEDVIEEFGLNKIGIAPAMLILLGFIVVCQLIGAFTLEFKIKNNLKIKKLVEEEV